MGVWAAAFMSWVGEEEEDVLAMVLRLTSLRMVRPSAKLEAGVLGPDIASLQGRPRVMIGSSQVGPNLGAVCRLTMLLCHLLAVRDRSSAVGGKRVRRRTTTCPSFTRLLDGGARRMLGGGVLSLW